MRLRRIAGHQQEGCSQFARQRHRRRARKSAVLSNCTSCLSTASCSTPGLATDGSIICASYARPSESDARLRAPAGYRASPTAPCYPWLRCDSAISAISRSISSASTIFPVADATRAVPTIGATAARTPRTPRHRDRSPRPPRGSSGTRPAGHPPRPARRCEPAGVCPGRDSTRRSRPRSSQREGPGPGLLDRGVTRRCCHDALLCSAVVICSCSSDPTPRSSSPHPADCVNRAVPGLVVSGVSGIGGLIDGQPRPITSGRRAVQHAVSAVSERGQGRAPATRRSRPDVVSIKVLIGLLGRLGSWC